VILVVGFVLYGCDDMLKKCAPIDGMGGSIVDAYSLVEMHTGATYFTGRIVCVGGVRRKWLRIEMDSFSCPDPNSDHYRYFARLILDTCLPKSSVDALVGVRPRVVRGFDQISVGHDGLLQIESSTVEDLRLVNPNRYVLFVDEDFRGRNATVIEPIASVLQRAASGRSQEVDNDICLLRTIYIHNAPNIQIHASGCRLYVTLGETQQLENRDCCICMDELCGKPSVTVLGCNHGFHSSCIGEWEAVQKNCPLCRRPSG
jgi:hypothetical protein